MKTSTESGIPVCYMLAATPRIEWGVAVRIVGDRVLFDDGGWNPVEHTFLSETQCLRHYRTPDPKDAVTKKLQRVAKQLERITESLR